MYGNKDKVTLDDYRVDSSFIASVRDHVYGAYLTTEVHVVAETEQLAQYVRVEIEKHVHSILQKVASGEIEADERKQRRKLAYE